MCRAPSSSRLRGRAGSLVVLLALAPLVTSCHGRDVALRVVATGVPATALSLEARLVLDGAREPQAHRFDLYGAAGQPTISFGLWLAAGATGALEVDVRALGTGDC